MKILWTLAWRSRALWGILLVLACFAQPASAIHLGIGSVGGLMQMPNSSYYLAVYGAYADMALESELFIIRGGYIERPTFKSQGYEDQDSGYFGLFGTKLTKTNGHGLYGYFGYGEQRGYIKSEDSNDASEYSSYHITGAVASLEYAAVFKSFAMALTHQTFLGYANSQQFKAYVLWPVNFYLLRIGYAL